MFITAGEIKTLTTFEEVAALESSKIEGYLTRADSWIRRATNRNFPDDVDAFIREDLRVASLMLVEYLWYWDNPDVRESVMGAYDGERLGSYSVGYKNSNNYSNSNRYPVKRKDNESYETGVKELDQILLSLRHQPQLGNLFRVSGPSDLV